MTDARNRIERLFHAQGHTERAEDLARSAQSELANTPGLATLAAAVAELAAAVGGDIFARVQDVADEAGIDLNNPSGR